MPTHDANTANTARCGYCGVPGGLHEAGCGRPDGPTPIVDYRAVALGEARRLASGAARARAILAALNVEPTPPAMRQVVEAFEAERADAVAVAVAPLLLTPPPGSDEAWRDAMIALGLDVVRLADGAGPEAMLALSIVSQKVARLAKGVR